MTDDTTVQKRIVAGVDYSDSSLHAAGWAAREAVDRHVALHLVHALELPASTGLTARLDFVDECRQAGQILLDRVSGDLRTLFPCLAIATEIAELGAVETLVAVSSGSELVAVGSRGHGGYTGLLLGSVSLGVAAHADCATAVVRGEQTAAPLNEIVLGVGPDEAEEPIEFAFASASALGAELRVIRAWTPFLLRGRQEDLADMDTRGKDEEADVAELLKGARERHPDVPGFISVARGHPVPVLIEAARGSRLLAVGARRRRGPLSVGMGHVVQGLLSHAVTPVAVVPVP
jgi:nucleotide-binding universal stress UspA family protein